MTSPYCFIKKNTFDALTVNFSRLFLGLKKLYEKVAYFDAYNARLN